MHSKGLNTQDVLSVLVFAECPEHGLEIGFVCQLSWKFRPMQIKKLKLKNHKTKKFDLWGFCFFKPKSKSLKTIFFTHVGGRPDIKTAIRLCSVLKNFAFEIQSTLGIRSRAKTRPDLKLAIFWSKYWIIIIMIVIMCFNCEYDLYYIAFDLIE